MKVRLSLAVRDGHSAFTSIEPFARATTMNIRAFHAAGDHLRQPHEARQRALTTALDSRAICDALRKSEAWTRLTATLRLSQREKAIVDCLLEFNDDEETIAITLGISKHTVHTHISRLYQKLGVRTHCQLALALLAPLAMGLCGAVARITPESDT